jgi:hypothetical protein
MAKTFLTNINLKGNQLLNAVIHSASSAPSALAAGQLYFNTGDNTFYYSTGTGTGNWQPVGVQYISAVGSNLSVTDGELNISTDPSFNTIALTQDGHGENILVGNDAYIGDVNASNFIGIKGNEDGTKGGIKFGSAKTETIYTDGSNLTLTADNDIVLLPGSDYAYIGTPLIDGSNRIATLGDITGDLTGYVTETGTQTLTNKTIDGAHVTGTTSFDVSGTQYLKIERSGVGTARITAADDLALRATNDVIIYPGNDVSGHTGKAYIHWGDDNWNAYPEREIATLGSIQGTADQINVDRSNSQATISLPSYINIDNGELHLKKTEYWLDGSQYGIIAANPYSNTLTISSTNYPLQLESHTGDIQMLPDSGVVTIGTGYGELHLQKTEYWRDGTQQGIIAAQSDGSIRITGVNNGLELETNSGDISVTANQNVSITSNNGDITLNPDGQVIVQNGSNLVVGNNIYVKNGIYAGGQDTATDGVIRIQDYNGNNLFAVTADGNNNNGSATVDVKGTLNVYRSGPTGAQVGQFIADSSNNLIINAIDNNLILQSDNSNSVYIGSVADDNKVATIGDLTSVQSGLTWKAAVNLLWNDSNAVLTGAAGTLAIDGHPTLTPSQNGYRILIPYGTNAGIWSYFDDSANWTLTRTLDADTDAEIKGAAVFVEEGTSYGATSWVQSNHYVTNFADQQWSQFSGQGTYQAGDGLTLDGTYFNVNVDNDSIGFTGNNLKVNLSNNGAIDTDGGLYIRTGDGLYINSNNLQVDYEGLENQLVTDGFVKTTDIADVTRKYTGAINGGGTGNPTTFNFTHNLDTYDVAVRVYQVSAGPDQFADVEVDVKRTGINTIQIGFAVAPATGENYSVVIVG